MQIQFLVTLHYKICSVALLGHHVLGYWNDAVGHIQSTLGHFCMHTVNIKVSRMRCKLCQTDEGNIKCVGIIKYFEQFMAHGQDTDHVYL